MSAILRLTRQGFGIELRRGPFEITLDGVAIATIERGDTIEAPIEPGHHILQLRAGRYSSRPRTLDSVEGQVVRFRCHGAMIWPRYVVSMVRPDLAISLRQE